MKVCVFGLGYVGSVTSVSLASAGHQVTGIELVPSKVKKFQSGELPIFEPGLSELYQDTRTRPQGGSLQVTSQLGRENDDTDAWIVCVGTPSLPSGQVDLSQLTSTLTTLGEALKQLSKRSTVIIRSTIPPGSTQDLLIPTLEKTSGKKAGRDFLVCFYPEFLREGKAVKDFFHPSLNIVGTEHDDALETIRTVFKVDRPLVRTQIRTAEMIKYVNNSFHALKVAFSNEISSVAKRFQVDTDELTEIFLSDTTLNISPQYLYPGFSFGGACLPKELRTVSSLAQSKGVKIPLIDSILESNQEHSLRLLEAITESQAKTIGFLGITFKPDTDDIRESALVDVIDQLLPDRSYQTGRQIRIHDHPKACERALEYFGDRVQVSSSVEELLTQTQFLVLGPYAPGPSLTEALKHYTGKIADLRWHDVPESVQKHSGYFTLC